MDLIAEVKHSLNTDWIFIVIVFIMTYLVILKMHFKDNFLLTVSTVFSLKTVSQLQRENTGVGHLLYYFPITILSLTLLVNYAKPDISIFYTNALWIFLFFAVKLVVIWLVVLIFEIKQRKELIWHSFIYEMIISMSLIPTFFLLFYSPIYQQEIKSIIGVILTLFFVFKLIRMGYISFFYSSFSKAHIIIYLCTLEILPVILLTKKLV